MRAVRVSPKFEVTIPVAVRRSMGLKPGMRFRVRQYKDLLIELIPIGRKRSSLDVRRRKEGKKPNGVAIAVSEPPKVLSNVRKRPASHPRRRGSLSSDA